MQLIFLLIVVGGTSQISAWSLANLGLDHSDYRIEHVSVFYVRAFLCLRPTNTTTGGTPLIPTLVEVPWPEPSAQLVAIKSAAAIARIYPTDLDHALHNGHQCNAIVAARGTAVDMRHGDLWVLDGGSAVCAPKLIEYDLVGRNEETHRYALGELAGRRFASVHIGPTEASGAGIGSGQPAESRRLFLTLADADADFLVVYGVAERRWWKLKLITSHNRIVVPHNVEFLATGQLYVADRSDHLWLTPKLMTHFTAKAVGVRSQRQSSSPTAVVQVKATFVADLLGRCGDALAADPAGRLYYDMPRDGAVVRWDTRRPLRAEHHDVLHFTSVPVAQIVVGYKGAVWVVGKETADGSGDEHCQRVLAHFTDSPTYVERIRKRQIGVGVNKWLGM